ncbi:MAG: sugar phosphate isomerase/epimerase [Phycisphaeraceae bacterium]|nr:sugar phosphate isomerase/epimerase [Phycisphaeraceae bacterium]
MPPTTRRQFLAASAVTAATAASLAPTQANADNHADNKPAFPEPTTDAKFAAPYGKPLFEISVAQWSLNKLFWDKKVDNRDFGKFIREEYNLDAVEWVNQFFKDKATDFGYLREMKERCDDHGVKTLLIMVDGEGQIGHPDAAERKKTVENHMKWVVASKLLGGQAIRVNAGSKGSYDEQVKLAADGLHQLTEFARGFGINVIVENHGGLSSNGKWLAEVMDEVGLPECGTLPDFGNFGKYNNYLGVHEMMPYAKAVSAKCHEFNADGSHKRTDFMRMMRIVLAHGYRGYVGVEYEGKEDKVGGVRKGTELLERCREALTA